MSASSTPFRRHLVPKSSTDDEIYRTIFNHLRYSLFDNFGESHNDSVVSIALKTNAVFSFDAIVFDSVRVESNSVSGRDRVLQLFTLVENRSRLDRSAIKTFLDLLLNLENQEDTSDLIEKKIKQKFCQFVDIKKEAIFRSADPEIESLLELTQSTCVQKQTTFEKLSEIINNHPISFVYLFAVIFSLLVIIMFVILVYISMIASVSTEAMSTELSTISSNITSTPITVITSPENINSMVTSDKTDHTISSSSPITQQPSPFISSDDKGSDTLPKYRVKARSYKEYIEKMTNLPPRHEVMVSIVLRSPLDWPTERNVILPNSAEITRLLIDGPISVDNLIDSLSQTVNIKLLWIRNAGDKLCNRNKGQLNLVKGINKRVYLPLLKSIVFQHFTSCVEVYETLGTYLEPLRELKSMVIHRSVIDDQNIVFINKIFQNNGHSLKELKLAHTKINVSKPILEGDGSLILPKLETLRLDSISSDGKDNEILVGKSLPKIFPNLRVLYSNYGYVQWSQFPRILQCKNLTKLGIGIKAPVNRTFFDVSFFKKYLPNVTAAHILLTFSTCRTPGNDGPGKNEIIGWENVKYPLAELVIRTNCKIHAIMNNTAASLKYYKVQEYKSENGQYIFTYKNH